MAFPDSLRARTRVSRTGAPASDVSAAARRCRRKFLRFFPGGFRDETYLDWERNYKAAAHAQWEESLGEERFRSLLERRRFEEIGALAVRIESRTNLLFSFEKMALRDALKPAAGSRPFAEGLYQFLHGSEPSAEKRFVRWCEVVGSLPRRQTRVLTWPVVTVFGFLAQPDRHIFLKPNVTRVAAHRYGFDFAYRSAPNWDTYESLRAFSTLLRKHLKDLRPRDMIDLQSFLWVQGSDEYAE